MARTPWQMAGDMAGSMGPEMQSSDLRPRAFVRLQRVPPDIRIFTPGRRFFSSKITFRPRSAAVMAAKRPAAPPPMMMQSKISLVGILI